MRPFKRSRRSRKPINSKLQRLIEVRKKQRHELLMQKFMPMEISEAMQMAKGMPGGLRVPLTPRGITFSKRELLMLKQEAIVASAKLPGKPAGWPGRLLTVQERKAYCKKLLNPKNQAIYFRRIFEILKRKSFGKYRWLSLKELLADLSFKEALTPEEFEEFLKSEELSYSLSAAQQRSVSGGITDKDNYQEAVLQGIREWLWRFGK